MLPHSLKPNYRDRNTSTNMHNAKEAEAPRPQPDLADTICTAVMLITASSLLWIVLTWAP